MSTNNPNIEFPEFSKDVSPVWANLLYKGIKNPDKVSKGLKAIKEDKDLLWQGLLGKSLLDRFITPGIDSLLPDSTKLDVLKREFKFSPTRKLDFTLGKRGDTAKLGFDWRF